MRNFKILLVVCLFLLNGCTITKGMWESRLSEDSIRSFFIDDQSNRIVLIGENKTAYQGKENYHYELDDKVEDIVKMYKSDEKWRYVSSDLNCPDKFGNIKKIFELGAKTKDLTISFAYGRAVGPKVFPWSMSINFNKKKLSKDEIDFLHQNNFKNASQGNRIFQRCPVKIIRYPASKETLKNFNPILFSSLNEIGVEEENTPLQTTGKVLLTPFTIVADIVLLPITVPYFLYSQVHESQTSHFCEGEFCGYDKLSKDSKPKK